MYPFDTIDAPPAVGYDADAETEDDEVDAAETDVDTATYAWGLKAVHAVPPILATAPWAGAGIGSPCSTPASTSGIPTSPGA